MTATGGNTRIVVPPETIERLGAGKRPAVRVSVNGYSAKGEDTRRRRVDKAVSLFLAGRQR